ncbi:hypothetical protein [Marinobacter halotolerans]|uniref:hypothetical protein n=1 Tax=Marinobacter halotolerans TaxID=1569211 RepID=UPI0017815F49|nr:hypothetical protein [Marinobacter halotolerans]
MFRKRRADTLYTQLHCAIAQAADAIVGSFDHPRPGPGHRKDIQSLERFVGNGQVHPFDFFNSVART